MLLGLDTSTAHVSACVYDEAADEVLAARDRVGPMRHGELLAPTIADLLGQAGLVRQDLTAVVVGVGPGPYTGLRVGVVTARTLGLALQIPVYGACSLDALALLVLESSPAGVGEPFLVTTDARRRELFWAAYDADGDRLSGPFVDRPADIEAAGRPVAGAGPMLYPEAFERPTGPRDPTASALVRLVAGERAELYDPEPIYLRRPDAAIPGAPKRVS